MTTLRDFTREDGKPGTVDKMWEVWHHEWARLPMLYAVGWDLTGDEHWRDMYRRYAWDAARSSVPPPSAARAYALQQAVFSFEPLVMIVDDDDRILRLLTHLLEKDGFRLIAVGGPEFLLQPERRLELLACLDLPDQGIAPGAALDQQTRARDPAENSGPGQEYAIVHF